jgi:small conductance mechanosensitive channel
VDLVALLHHAVDVADVVRRLKAKVSTIPNVLTIPAPDVEILQFTELGPQLAVRPYTHTDSYWQVYLDTNKAIAAVAAEAGVPSASACRR